MQARLAASLVLALAGNAYAGDPLHVIVHGSIDAGAVRERIARELGGEVTLGDRCDAPCLDVSVSGKRAKVVFTPGKGDVRGRTIELGKDKGQWPMVIALLAGNVVRDEASDVLAQLPVGPPMPPPVAEPAPEAPVAEPVVVEPVPDKEATEPAPLPPLVVTPPASVPVVASGEGVAAAVVPEPEHERMLASIGLVPGLSTDWTHVGRVDHVLSIDLLVGVSGGSSLLTLSGIADIERGNVWGTQIGGVVTVARSVAGFQVAGVAAVTGDLQGVQIAGTAAVADSVEGFQVAGVAAVARKRGGSQIAGVAAVADSDTGVQVGGVAAVARGSSNIQIGGVAAVSTSGTANIQVGGVAASAHEGNIQIAGVASVADSANIQIAGVVNVAKRMHGVQVAPINVAREVSGVQVGLINVGGDADGFSFGLINIVPGGRADLEAAVDSSSMGTLLFRHGGNRWHNVYGIGGHPVDETGPSNDVWMYGLGFGPSWRVAHNRVDLELMAWEVNHGARQNTDISLLTQLRLSVAHGIGPMGIVVGGALNTYISNDTSSPLYLERKTPGSTMDTSVTTTVWPSIFAGVRI